MSGYIRQDTTGDIANGNVIDATDLNNEFNALVTAFSTGVGHSHGGAAGEGAPITVIGPNLEYVALSTDFSPNADDVYDLGTSAFRWRNIEASGNVKVGGGLTWQGVASGNGGGITNLPATSLTGTINNARLSGSYSFSGLTLTASLEAGGSVTASNFMTTTSTGDYRGSGDQITLSPGLGTSVTGDETVRIRPRGSGTVANSTTWSDTGDMTVRGSVTATTFHGNVPAANLTGTIASARITSVAASALTGTIASARLSGTYTGISGIGTISSGSISSGFGNINIGTSTFTGNGSGLTNIPAGNLTGTVASARLSGNYSFSALTLSNSISASSGNFTVQSSGGHMSAGNITSTTGNVGGSEGLNLRPRGGGTSTNQTVINNNGHMSVNGNITASGNVTANSDQRLKKNIVEIKDALDKIKALSGVFYEDIKTGEARVGLIAQDVLPVVPEVVQVPNNPDEYLSVAYGNIVAVLIEAVKELSEKVEAKS